MNKKQQETDTAQSTSDGRNVFIEPSSRALIRTADVYQTELDSGVEGYSETLLSIVANFKNAGKPEGFNVQSMVGKSKRGEVALRLFAVVDDASVDPVFVKVGFKTRGCLAMTACASVICEMVEGKTFAQALAIAPADVERAVGGVPPDKKHTTIFAVEAVRGLVGDWMFRAGVPLAKIDAMLPCDTSSVQCILCEHCSLRDLRVDALVQAAQSEVESTQASNNEETTSKNCENGAEDEVENELEVAKHNALANVFDDVRKMSADSKLVTPGRWAEIGIVPQGMSTEDFEMYVYTWLAQYQAQHASEIEAEIQKERKQASATKSAMRAVGIPPKIPNRRLAEIEANEKNGITSEPSKSDAPATDKPKQEVISENEQHSKSIPEKQTELEVPQGYKLENIKGEFVLVKCEGKSDATQEKKEINCKRIKVLTGVYTYYLYDETKMTNTYAHWAFLAAENNPQVTFAECVREDCRTYPRPFAAECFKNPPFNMTASEIEKTWQAVSASGNFNDICSTQASNGDVYFYSTSYLTPEYAASLAEYDAVERPANV